MDCFGEQPVVKEIADDAERRGEKKIVPMEMPGLMPLLDEETERKEPEDCVAGERHENGRTFRHEKGDHVDGTPDHGGGKAVEKTDEHAADSAEEGEKGRKGKTSGRCENVRSD